MVERLIMSLVVSVGSFVCEIFYRMYIKGFSYNCFNKISINIAKFCDHFMIFQFEILTNYFRIKIQIINHKIQWLTKVMQHIHIKFIV